MTSKYELCWIGFTKPYTIVSKWFQNTGFYKRHNRPNIYNIIDAATREMKEEIVHETNPEIATDHVYQCLGEAFYNYSALNMLLG